MAHGPIPRNESLSSSVIGSGRINEPRISGSAAHNKGGSVCTREEASWRPWLVRLRHWPNAPLRSLRARRDCRISGYEPTPAQFSRNAESGVDTLGRFVVGGYIITATPEPPGPDSACTESMTVSALSLFTSTTVRMPIDSCTNKAGKYLSGRTRSTRRVAIDSSKRFVITASPRP